MATPEVYLAHSKSLAKKAISGEIQLDDTTLTERLSKSYGEDIARRIIETATKIVTEEEKDKCNIP